MRASVFGRVLGGPGRAVEQGGVQAHSQGELYPVIVYGKGDKWGVQLGVTYSPMFDTQAEAVTRAKATKSMLDSTGWVAATSMLVIGHG